MVISRKWVASQYREQAALCETKANIGERINIVAENDQTSYEHDMMQMFAENSQARVEKMTRVMAEAINKMTQGFDAFDLDVPIYVYKALQKQFPKNVALAEFETIPEHSSDEVVVTVVFAKDKKAYKKHEAER